MGLVPVHGLVPGMTVGANVKERSGRVLLAEGVALTAKHITILETWGVVEVDIVGAAVANEPRIPAEVSPLAVAAAEESLAPRFASANLQHPMMRELLRIAALRSLARE